MNEDILWADGQDNYAGIRSIVRYAYINDIEVFPEVPTTPTSLEDRVTISDAITFKAGKGWSKIYTTPETAKFDCNNVGERDGVSWENMLEFFHPGSAAQLMGFADAAKNSNLVYLVEELNGTKRLVGSKVIPSETKTNFTSAQAIAERKGATVTVRAIGPIAPIYTGAVTDTPVAPE